MKQGQIQLLQPLFEVASRAEAWIETREHVFLVLYGRVASRAEAWIETPPHASSGSPAAVASRAEAWIETRRWPRDWEQSIGRLPRGGVD